MSSVRAVLAGSAFFAVLLVVACAANDEHAAGVATAARPPAPLAHPPHHRHGHFPGDRVRRSPSDAEDFWWIGAESTGSAGVPNNGVQAIIQSVSDAPSGGCFDCWTSESLTNGTWGQIGFSACDPSVGYPFEAFYQIWNTSTEGALPDGGVDYGVFLVDGETTNLSTGDHLFTMSVVSGTTWAFAVDGVVLGTYDMGSATANEVNAISTLCEEGDGVAAQYVPPQVDMPVTMDVLQSGTWSPVAAGDVYNTAGLSGVVGHLQDAGPDESVVVGGGAPYLAPGTPLWTSASGAEPPDAGPATSFPPFVTITAPVAGTTVSGTVAVTTSVHASTGSIASVVFYDDTGTLLATDATAPYDFSWDTSGLADGGTHYIQAGAEDHAGNTTWVTVYVNVVALAPADAGPQDSGEPDANAPVDAGGLDAGPLDASVDDAGALPDSGGGADATVATDSGIEDAGEAIVLDATTAVDASVSNNDEGSPTGPPAGSNNGCSCDLARHSSSDALVSWPLFALSLAASGALRRARRRRS